MPVPRCKNKFVLASCEEDDIMIDEFTRGIAAYLHGSFPPAYLAIYLGGILASFGLCVYHVISNNHCVYWHSRHRVKVSFCYPVVCLAKFA